MTKKGIRKYYYITQNDRPFGQEEFEEILKESISSHLISDVGVSYFLSGGIDSSVIGALGEFRRALSIGVEGNSEISFASVTAAKLGHDFWGRDITANKLIENWIYLSGLRNEPLQLPNEGLIFELANSMNQSDKVFLSGEGADELMFGYDRIFNWCNSVKSVESIEFLKRYGYAEIEVKSSTERLINYVDDLNYNKTALNFCEDFFIHHHLPTLLRRMDFASMAASKEARVPFVTKKLFNYMYRKPFDDRCGDAGSKIPLRKVLYRENLSEVCNRPKIGFSASIGSSERNSKLKEYETFRAHFGGN
jgi:asparagine synthase (glutamine-hydrolysing)